MAISQITRLKALLIEIEKGDTFLSDDLQKALRVLRVMDNTELATLHTMIQRMLHHIKTEPWHHCVT